MSSERPRRYTYAPPAQPEAARPLPPLVVVVVMALLVGVAAGAGSAGAVLWLDRRSDQVPGVSLPSVRAPVVDEAPEPGSVAAVAEAVLPTVVSLQVRGFEQQSSGSGVVIRPDGYILTNNHVVSGALDGGSITVTFSDGAQVPARIVGRSPTYDLAVVRVDRRDLPTAVLGDSERLRVGDTVVAFGAPLGLTGTVTTGIVSALDRPVTTADAGEASYISAIQTDAPINPGNSGGPLVDSGGRVIAITSAIATLGGRGSGSIGLGFAIPITQARDIAEQLIASGEAEYPVVGVVLDLSFRGEGARVQSAASAQAPVTPGGPADHAGIEPGDVIVAVDGQPVATYEEFVVLIRSHAPGDQVALTVHRGDRELTADVTLDATVG